jgi:hypothetical protein
VTPTDRELELVVSALLEVVPGLAGSTLAAGDTLTGDLHLDSLTIASLAVALNRTLGQSRPIETWIFEAAATGGDTLGGLAAWLAADQSGSGS